MTPGTAAGETSSDQQSRRPAAPSISLPKGGGAIRSLGEKFAANPVTGTESMSVPIATSPGRSGFGPQLSLSYGSGVGNGPFGFGWSPRAPSISTLRRASSNFGARSGVFQPEAVIRSGFSGLRSTHGRHARSCLFHLPSAQSGSRRLACKPSSRQSNHVRRAQIQQPARASTWSFSASQSDLPGSAQGWASRGVPACGEAHGDDRTQRVSSRVTTSYDGHVDRRHTGATCRRLP